VSPARPPAQDAAGAALDAARARFWLRPKKSSRYEGPGGLQPEGCDQKTPRRTLRMRRSKWRRVGVGLTPGWRREGPLLILIRFRQDGLDVGSSPRLGTAEAAFKAGRTVWFR
jgi:hypothetical protein